MTNVICQSCGMPIGSGEAGTNADGSPSAEYCTHCFRDGKYTYDCTLDQMIEACLPAMAAVHPEVAPAQARSQLDELLPTLKRWI